MIGKLTGRVEYRGSDHVLLDVRGVGYIVHCSERTLARQQPGEAAVFYTTLMVREDLMQLFGFSTLHEKEWHRMLMSVQGVGAKAALAILGALGAEGVARAVALGDAGAVRAAPGVGPKIAQRVVNELRDKAPALMAQGTVPGRAQSGREANEGAGFVTSATSLPAPANASASAEALSALVNLGYSHGDAAGAVAQAAGAEAEVGTSGLIRAALRLLAPKD